MSIFSIFICIFRIEHAVVRCEIQIHPDWEDAESVFMTPSLHTPLNTQEDQNLLLMTKLTDYNTPNWMELVIFQLYNFLHQLFEIGMK